MSVGSNVRRVVRELNLSLRLYKYMSGFKPGLIGATYDFSKPKQVLYSKPQLNSVSILESQAAKFYFISPKIDVAIEKSIIEPDKTKINFELPIKNSADTPLDLPLYIEKEIAEPNGVIIRKEGGSHLVRIRKKKMRKHKRQKYRKKYKIELQRKKLLRRLEKENNFKNLLRAELSKKDTFSAEKYVEETLEKVYWTPPVTKVKGRLAPQWVIKQYLEKEKEKKILEERIKETMN